MHLQTTDVRAEHVIPEADLIVGYGTLHHRAKKHIRAAVRMIGADNVNVLTAVVFERVIDDGASRETGRDAVVIDHVRAAAPVVVPAADAGGLEIASGAINS